MNSIKNKQYTPMNTDNIKIDEEPTLITILGRTLKSACVAIVVWLWGHFGFSFAWICIGLFWYIMHNELRKQKVAKKAYAQLAMLDERRAIQSRILESLSWVYFPDVEKVEWLNKIIKQMWPFIANYVKELMLTTIEPAIQDALAQNSLKSFKSFKFEKIDIGDIPLRVDGLKLYSESTKKGEIIFDMEISYVGDSNIKVAVQGINAGCKALTLSGNLRVVLRPLINEIPIVGGLTVFFLNKPNITFDLTSAANLLDMPLLSKSLRSIVQDIIASFFVLPNRFPISISEFVDERMLTEMKYPIPQGVIALHVLEATELRAADKKLIGKPSSDPYCIISVGARSMKTSVISSSLEPVWNQFFESSVYNKFHKICDKIIVDQKHGQFIVIDVYDEDKAMEDDNLGQATIDIELMAKAGTIDVWMPLENVNTGKIHLQATWLYLSNSYGDVSLRGGGESLVRYSAAVLIVTVESATRLPVGEKSRKERNAFVNLRLGDKKFKTTIKFLTCEPHWDENFQFLVDDPDRQSLMLEVLHKGSSEKKMASLNIPLSTISPADNPRSRVYDLPECGSYTKISLRMCLKLLTTHSVKDTSDYMFAGRQTSTASDDGFVDGTRYEDGFMEKSESSNIRNMTSPRDLLNDNNDAYGRFGRIRITIRYSTQRGQLVVVAHECKNLIPCDKDNLADPYVRMYVLPDSGKHTRKKTKTIKNNLNPVFDEIFTWKMTIADAGSRVLDIAVKNDVTLFSKSRTEMGKVKVDLATIGDLQQATTAWFDFRDPDYS